MKTERKRALYILSTTHISRKLHSTTGKTSGNEDVSNTMMEDMIANMIERTMPEEGKQKAKHISDNGDNLKWNMVKKAYIHASFPSDFSTEKLSQAQLLEVAKFGIA